MVDASRVTNPANVSPDDIGAIVSRKVLLAAANGVVPVSWEDMRRIEDALATLRLSLTASEKRLKDADWLIKNVQYRDDSRWNVWGDIKRMYDEDGVVLDKEQK